MPVWMHRAGGIEWMKKQKVLGGNHIIQEVQEVSEVDPTIGRKIKVSSGKTYDVPANIEGFLLDCPILDGTRAKRVHMQVAIVWAFYNHPTISNSDLTDLLMTIFPESNYRHDPNGRAKADRNKFNSGQFRCMGGWHPNGETDLHYARAEEVTNASTRAGS